MRERDDRIVGLLLGLAAGDQIGGPLRMALRVAESLGERRGLDLSDVGGRYLDWWREGAFDSGPTAKRVLELVESGVSFERAVVRADQEAGGMTAGCNPAHRSAPLAMCAFLEDSELEPAAKQEARLTHAHELAGDVAAAVARLCRALVRGVPWPDALGGATRGRRTETRRALEVMAFDEIRPSGFAPETLGAAIHFVDSSDSFAIALARSIRFAGQDNYCPVLVGSWAAPGGGAHRSTRPRSPTTGTWPRG